MNNKLEIKIPVTIDIDVLEKLTKRVGRHGTTVSDLIMSLLNDFLEMQEPTLQNGEEKNCFLAWLIDNNLTDEFLYHSEIIDNLGKKETKTAEDLNIIKDSIEELNHYYKMYVDSTKEPCVPEDIETAFSIAKKWVLEEAEFFKPRHRQ